MQNGGRPVAVLRDCKIVKYQKGAFFIWIGLCLEMLLQTFRNCYQIISYSGVFTCEQEPLARLVDAPVAPKQQRLVGR